MFGRKKKQRRAEVRLTLLSPDGGVIMTCPAGEYDLPEGTVIALSTEYFDDPEPCDIHRSAVHRRAMMELMELCPAGNTVSAADLPAAMRAWFPPQTAAVRISEE